MSECPMLKLRVWQAGLLVVVFVVWHLLTKPGLWLQRITTQPPSDDQVEGAIKALDLAMDLEKKNGGELVIA